MKLGGRKLKWDPVNEVILNDPEANALLQVSMREPYTLYRVFADSNSEAAKQVERVRSKKTLVCRTH